MVRSVQRKELFFFLFLLYLGFLGYGNLCLFDHLIDFSHPGEISDFSSSHRHHESKDSRSLVHSCLVIQFLLSTSIVSGLFLFTFAPLISSCNWIQYEKVYRTPILSYANRSPPLASLNLPFRYSLPYGSGFCQSLKI